MMGHILSVVRGDFRSLANSVLQKAQGPNRVILPVSFDETHDAVQRNLKTRKQALRYLAARVTDSRVLMDFLRKATYDLSPIPYASYAYGFEFEEKNARPRA